ncbi:MAG: 3-deoxy-7-phosphoheptulonate synthase [Sphaerochaetaceae bacterium]|jgi:3-deoxy-7-phosphoheptulonate synthase|nr:3-deoxy-7-phosphoheptulonate synthase [Sphaerochaetaceae bacterium]NLO60196.1 3-deoxy-7-phosphoheptulonate synthase [Spirochaetales bacterium]MDD2404851.1 3-deoxy-7-phosphoheptulonate synthase [Sphaerochaetaceae bacterium]MDD3671307.1 3-deoxy-7-phosphoheptulonate synthase [Sphaerochaetaceae bacterium]MDD4258461.1 3-deoxy-7-phosphoheptulonate synthase [Sphaerochaetaceae bacterium]
MIVVLKQQITEEQKSKIRDFLKSRGFKVKEIIGQEETVLGAVGTNRIDIREVAILEGVANVVPISKPYKLASRELKKSDTIVRIKNVKIGGPRIVVAAGPCAVESREQIRTIAKLVRDAGAVMLRGGAFKPRSSPYAFQGLGEEGLKYLKEAGEECSMPVTTEIVSPKDVDMMLDYVDMFQIGARNMQNFELLKEVGKTGRPVLLKRGLSATIEEWLMAAEYLMASGTDQIVLCERGIRTYEQATRNTLDISAIPVVTKLSHLPIIGDPSHATGLRDMVSPTSLAIVAAGASGLMVEVHDNPEKALSDGPQSLFPEQFEKLMRDIQALCPVVGKSLERIPTAKAEIEIWSSDTNRQIGSTMNVAFQGDHGAFSEQAIRQVFDDQVATLPCRMFSDAFEKVQAGEARYAVLPVENTLGGTINETLDLLNSYPNLTVVGEKQIRIVHCLIGLPGSSLDQLEQVYTHPQGLAQCSRFLETELPQAQALPFFDTAGAVAHIAQLRNPKIAAIASSAAARYHKMEILREGIETDSSNFTRFYVISREEHATVMRSVMPVNRVAMVFSVGDHPGALFEVLQIMSQYGMNMKKLESRPIPGKPWEYSFFVESELVEQARYDKAVEKLIASCRSFRILGTFRSDR